MTRLTDPKSSHRYRRLGMLAAPVLALGVLAAQPAMADPLWYGHHHKHRAAYVGAGSGYVYAPPPVVYVAPPPRMIYAPAPRIVYVAPPAPIYPSFSFGITVPLH